MNISTKGLNLIKQFEGCRLKAYLDSSGIATIGYGFTYYTDGVHVRLSDKPLTQEEADRMFILLVKPYADSVVGACSVPLNQNQLDSLTSLAYNIGVGAFKKSKLRENINNKLPIVESNFTEYCHAGGQVLQGLINRRKLEYKLYMEENISTDVPTEVNGGVTEQTLQTVKVNSINVNYTKTVNGVEETHNTGDMKVTHEIVEALKTDPYFVDNKFNIVIE